MEAHAPDTDHTGVSASDRLCVDDEAHTPNSDRTGASAKDGLRVDAETDGDDDAATTDTDMRKALDDAHIKCLKKDSIETVRSLFQQLRAAQ